MLLIFIIVFFFIVPPAEWIPRKIGYEIDTLDYTIEKPIEQCFMPIQESKNAYLTNSTFKTPMTVKDYHKMATSEKYASPKRVSHEELEKQYWRDINSSPPIYGCDVSNSISDPDLEVQ